jgi:oxygen-independent coproporphyrinogen-3 oxidase
MQASSPLGEPGFGVYIHWPYCEAKCPYCDFNSYARRSITEPEYLAAALAELEHYAAQTSGRTVTSIFFGGGTPSLMAASTVGTLIDRVTALWPIDAQAEITLEANPSSVEAGRFAGYRAAGVNRVSLGVQALDDDQLRFLGRLHNAAEARGALDIAAAHFERMSFDLIYARPGQTAQGWRDELSAALSLARGHLSLYQLTIEPGTTFFELERRGKLRVPESDHAAVLYEVTQEVCEAAGLPAYEVSNHAAPGHEGRHNLVYWRYGDYLGVGPGAHGRLTLAGHRFATVAERNPVVWYRAVMQHGHGLASRDDLDARTAAEEMLLMGLRLREGLDMRRLEEVTGHALAHHAIASMEADGLVVLADSRLRATRSGMLVLNAVIEQLAAALAPIAEEAAA